MESRTLVNVCGATRSGTTMLDLMLGNAPNAFSCGEVYARFRPQQKHHFQAKCRCGLDPCPVWRSFQGIPEELIHVAIFQQQEVEFVIDSSKDLCWLVDSQNWAIKNDIKVFKLLSWKDPIKLAYSHWKRDRGLNGWRREFTSYYRKFFSLGFPFRSVSFEELVSNPKQKLKDICSLIGMSYYDGKEHFWQKEHHYLFGSHGVSEQVAKKNSTIKRAEATPPEFEVLIDDLRKQISDDIEVQQILEKLKQAEVSSYSERKVENQLATIRPPYPVWYYARRTMQILQQYSLVRSDWRK